MREISKVIISNNGLHKIFIFSHIKGVWRQAFQSSSIITCKPSRTPAPLYLVAPLFSHVTSTVGPRWLLKPMWSHLCFIQREGESPSFKDSFKKLLTGFEVTTHWPKLRHTVLPEKESGKD